MLFINLYFITYKLLGDSNNGKDYIKKEKNFKKYVNNSNDSTNIANNKNRMVTICKWK